MVAMDDDPLWSIGDLARLTGLTVKTIRFWSDVGVVPPTRRTPVGYRLYGREALARLGLVRTLRDLGIDLATIQRVMARDVTVAEVAAAHAEALDTQIRTLRLQRAVLRAVASRGSTPEEMELMHKLATLSEQERRRLIDDFVHRTFDGLDVGDEFLATLRDAVPELPDDPAPAQTAAWVELAELVQDEGFRAGVRRAAADQVASRGTGPWPDPDAARQVATLVRERVTTARETGIEPDSAAARPIVDELVRAYAELSGRDDSPAFRTWLLERLEISHGSRFERYWELLAVISGRSAAPSLAPSVAWLIAALRTG